MARRRRRIARSETRGHIKESMFEVKRLIAARLAEKSEGDPDKLAGFVKLGLVDEAALRSLPEDVDFAEMVQRFRDRIAEISVHQPSVLERLEVRPLEMFGQAPKDAPDESQTPLSIMFCDLEGFTSFTSTQGDLEASAMLRDHYDTVDSIARGRGGSVIKTIGDGHMLAFGEARAAVLAGVELADVHGGPLRVRVGGHEGEVIKTTDDILGHVVNVAARVADTARGGEALVTSSLRTAAGPIQGIEFDEPNTVRLRGLEDEVELWRAHH